MKNLSEKLICVFLPIRRIGRDLSSSWKKIWMAGYIMSMIAIVIYLKSGSLGEIALGILKIQLLFAFISYFYRRWQRLDGPLGLADLTFMRLASLWAIFLLANGPFKFSVLSWYSRISISPSSGAFDSLFPNFWEGFPLILMCLSYFGMWKISAGFRDSSVRLFSWKRRDE